jgi:hypothetical protein
VSQAQTIRRPSGVQRNASAPPIVSSRWPSPASTITAWVSLQKAAVPQVLWSIAVYANALPAGAQASGNSLMISSAVSETSCRSPEPLRRIVQRLWGPTAPRRKARRVPSFDSASAFAPAPPTRCLPDPSARIT